MEGYFKLLEPFIEFMKKLIIPILFFSIRIILASIVVYALAQKLNDLAHYYSYSFANIDELAHEDVIGFLAENWGFAGVVFLLYSSLWTIVSPFFLILLAVAFSSEAITLVIFGQYQSATGPAVIVVILAAIALGFKNNKATQLLEEESAKANFSDKATANHLLETPLGRR